MENNKTLYVKYKTNPVGINTHLNNEGTAFRLVPIETASRLLSVFFSNTPANELDQYALHLPDGVSRTALTEDCFASVAETDTTLDPCCLLSAIGDLGSKSREPLLIKSTTNAQAVSSTTSTKLSKSLLNIKNDGVVIDAEQRELLELVEELMSLVKHNSMVLVASRVGSGRNSLFKLYKAAAIRKEVIQISCNSDKSLFELLKSKGLDFDNEHLKDEFARKEVVVILNDAQAKYGETMNLKRFIKTVGWCMPRNARFIISVTHLGEGCPEEFQSLPRL